MSSIPSTNAFYRLVSLCLYSAITVAVPAQAQNFGLPFAEPETMGVSPTSLQQITEMLQRHVDDGLIAGAVAGVARNGKTVYLQAIGSQHIENDVPMRTDSIFQVRSMSKPITALAALQLVEQGRLGLQDPVSDHIPQFGNMFVYINADEPFISAQRRPERDMTIEHLLLNTAGLSHRNGVLYREHQVRSRADTLEQLARKVARVPLIGDPGEQWVYSISMTILGRVVEVVSGQALDDYLDDEVYGPLGMDDTAFYVPPEKAERLARVYQVGEESSLSLVPDMEIPITEEPPLLEGAAGIVSTVPDYLRFLQSLLNGGELDGARVLQSGTVTDMTRNHIPDELMPIGTNPERPMLDRGWGYGLAVVVDETQSEFGVNNGEFGWNGSLGTFSWADPETGTVAVLMLQIQPSGAYNVSGQFKNLVYQSLMDR